MPSKALSGYFMSGTQDIHHLTILRDLPLVAVVVVDVVVVADVSGIVVVIVIIVLGWGPRITKWDFFFTRSVPGTVKNSPCVK